MTISSVAVVGAGTMGAPMALRLQRAGFAVTVCDRNAAAVEPLVAAGLSAVGSAAEVADSDVVIIVVATADQARRVLTGPDGLASGAGAGRSPLVVVMSTVSSAVVADLATDLESAGIRLLDAPVSGGPLRAAEGRLTILAGGAADEVAELRPVFEALSTRIIHCGPRGAGADAKVINNVIGTVVPVLMGEVCRLALERGIALEAMVDVLQASSGRTYVTEEPGETAELLATFSRTRAAYDSTLSIIRKDLGLARDLADAASGDYPGIANLVALADALGSETYATWRLVGGLPIDDR